MEYELILLLELIKQKTGKEIRVFSELDEGVYSSVEGERIERPEYKVVGVTPDKDRNKTYFRFRHSSESFVGYIDGCEKSDESFACLAVALLENGVIKENFGSKSESLRAIVLGEEKDANIQKYMTKYSISDESCSAFVIYCDNGRLSEVTDFMENFKSSDKDCVLTIDENTCAYIKFHTMGMAEGEYQSLAEYAELIVQSVKEELGIGIKVGVGGTVKSFSECSISYRQAVSAVRMGEVFSGGSSVMTYKEYVLVKILEDVPKYKLQEFLDILLEPEAKNILSDDEMVTTAEEFLKTSLNVSETSRNLYMHRNTLMYRLDKIDRSTGLDIRKFQDAVTFKLILILYKLLGYGMTE
ncbi:MAG: helix-turn-helix domain-containing protein [Clostridia bacterium]|nr:helix-turn-helix domain-containing protein [Clostridia bacterium]